MGFLLSSILVALLVILLQMLLGIETQSLTDDRLQIRRKIQHVSTGMLFISLERFFTENQAAGLFWFGTVVIFAFHRFRMAYPSVNQLFQKLCAAHLRPHEKNSLPGAFYFMMGCALTCSLFCRKISILALLYLSIGDPAASFFGVLFDKKIFHFKNGKTAVGLLSMIFLCFVCSIIYLGLYLGVENTQEILLWAIVGSISAGFAESFSIGKPILDDNLRIPVFSGLSLWILQNHSSLWFLHSQLY